MEKAAYTALTDDDDGACTCTHKVYNSGDKADRRTKSFAIQLLFLLVSLALLFAAALHHLWATAYSNNQQKTWNVGHLAEIRGPSIFHANPHTPSAAIDASWAGLLKDKFMLIPDEDFPHFDFRATEPMRGSTQDRNGTLAVFEYVHALHCVYTLWKQTYPEYYKEDYKAMTHDPEMHHAHLDHCADFLRQVILCNADLTVNTYSVNGSLGLNVDIESSHTCINLDAANDYANRVSVELSDVKLVPQG